MQASSVVNSSSLNQVVRNLEGSGYIGHRFKSEEGQEINIQYLKHVVLKFMLSRESEVSPRNISGFSAHFLTF